MNVVDEKIGNDHMTNSRFVFHILLPGADHSQSRPPRRRAAVEP